MGFSDTFKKLVGIEEVEDEFDEEELQAEKERISKENIRKSSSEYKAARSSQASEAPKQFQLKEGYLLPEQALLNL